MYSYLDRLFIQVICGNLVTTNHNLVQNVVQTYQFVNTIECNQPTQNKAAVVHWYLNTCLKPG